MYRLFLELLKSFCKKILNMAKELPDVFKQGSNLDKHFLNLRRILARNENRVIQTTAAFIFFVCLFTGAGVVSSVNATISADGQEQQGEMQQAVVEKRPIIQAMIPLGTTEEVWRNDSALDSYTGNEKEENLHAYINLIEEFQDAKSIGTRYVSATCVNFRVGASLDARVLDKLYRNTKVELLADEKNGFSLIRYNGQIGYMYSEYLSESQIKTEYTPQYNYSNITNLRERVATIAKNNQGTQPCASGYCAKWVSGVYQAAGIGYPGGHAIDYWTRWGSTGSTSLDNIPVGAVVVGSGSGSVLGNQYGHVGIYIGNGLVADNVGYHRIISLQEWVAYNVGVCHGYCGYIGWVWPYGKAIPE